MKSRHYEVTNRNPLTGKEETIGITRAKSEKGAIRNLEKHHNLPDRVHVYPVKITKSKLL